jgi:hypothetical protein
MNKPSKWVVGVALAFAGVFGSVGSALAWHHHGGPRVSFGFNFGPAPFWGPGWGWWGPPVVYAPPAVIVTQPASPPVYVERNDQQAAQPSGFWYYCEASRGYWPYVKDCPGGWRAVPPAPSPAQ